VKKPFNRGVPILPMVSSVMRRIAVAIFVLLAQPAAAQSVADSIASGDAALQAGRAAEAVPHYRRSIDAVGAEAAVDQAFAHIVKTFGEDHLAVAGNRYLYGVLRLRRHNDRAGAQEAFAHATRIRNAKVKAWLHAGGVNGPVQHAASGIVFFERAGALLQFRRDINDDEGFDVSIAYRADGAHGGVSVTLYIYRPEGEIDAVFAQEIAGIRNFNRQAAMQKRGNYSFDIAERKFEGREARFEYLAESGPVATRLLLFRSRADTVKLRVTYRPGDTAFVDKQIGELLRSLHWPK
jgi:hypothetical protein